MWIRQHAENQKNMSEKATCGPSGPKTVQNEVILRFYRVLHHYHAFGSQLCVF